MGEFIDPAIVPKMKVYTGEESRESEWALSVLTVSVRMRYQMQ